MIPRWLQWTIRSVAALIAAVFLASFFAEEPLRRYAERSADEAVDGYSLKIGTLEVHPFTLSIAMGDVVVRQEGSPDAPVLTVPRMELDARLAPLLVGKAAVEVRLRDPDLSVTRRQLEAAVQDGEETVNKESIAWQDRIRNMVSFDASLLIKNGRVTYEGPPAVEPIRVTGLDVVIHHLTNRPRDDGRYPADVQIDTQLLDHAEVEIFGRADPLSKPIPAAQFSVRVKNVDVGRTLAVVGHTDLPLKSGTLSLAGHLEWGPTERAVTLDRLDLVRPRIEYVNRPGASATGASSGHGTSQVSTWQEQALALFPVSIREAAIDDGTVIYRHAPAADPIQLGNMRIAVQDIRNVVSKSGDLPSRLQASLQVGAQGLLEIDGRGDLFAKPSPAIETRVRVNQLRLRDCAPVASAYSVRIRDGLFRMDGRVKHDQRTIVTLDSFLLEHGKVDYVYKRETKGRQQRQLKRGAAQAARAHQDPSVVFLMEHGKILASEVGFIDHTASPNYRIYLAELNAEMDNFSNRLREGSGVVKITGKFMGSGPTVITGTFRPEKPRPDFSLEVKIIKTEVASLNDLLTAYGNVDTHAGKFALFSEITVKDSRIDGYVKPLFQDVDVYDPDKDQDKAMSTQLYNAVIGGVTALLENEPRDEVATHSDMSGPVDNPRADTWEIIGTLIQNAFFKAILPGFEGSA